MKHVMVRYRVKPEFAAHNVELVRDVYSELHESNPAGLRYATFCLDDGVSFVHVSEYESADGISPLNAVAAFQRFLDKIADRCEAPPVFVELDEIGSYRLFTEVPS